LPTGILQQMLWQSDYNAPLLLACSHCALNLSPNRPHDNTMHTRPDDVCNALLAMTMRTQSNHRDVISVDTTYLDHTRVCISSIPYQSRITTATKHIFTSVGGATAARSRYPGMQSIRCSQRELKLHMLVHLVAKRAPPYVETAQLL
jgi:hypothetical protein